MKHFHCFISVLSFTLQYLSSIHATLFESNWSDEVSYSCRVERTEGHPPQRIMRWGDIFYWVDNISMLSWRKLHVQSSALLFALIFFILFAWEKTSFRHVVSTPVCLSNRRVALHRWEYELFFQTKYWLTDLLAESVGEVDSHEESLNVIFISLLKAETLLSERARANVSSLLLSNDHRRDLSEQCHSTVRNLVVWMILFR